MTRQVAVGQVLIGRQAVKRKVRRNFLTGDRGDRGTKFRGLWEGEAMYRSVDDCEVRVIMIVPYAGDEQPNASPTAAARLD